ncbi:hypothetical protein DMH15_16715 [Streptomyces sp. WAC 06725]|uniref:hypothetical protein n=1 Tax=Streptomyces sp. WAC 06725 TaxID=2203209 RepID=UPI000F73D1F2|nr:hypothetical protein [Streptomyces sp. WAC 06725]RSO40020.1 hypothetical protein DMH15_16715 [Streptomyces sp. WAC 06725]
MLTINVAVLLAVIVFLLIRRRVQARSRVDQSVTVALALTLGVLVAQTGFGRWILQVVGSPANGISQIGQ